MFLLLSIALAAEPPSTEVALATAEAWQAWAVGSPTVDEVEGMLRLDAVPAGVTEAYATAFVDSLAPDAAMGRLLRDGVPQLALAGPDYTRVVFSSEPPLSLVVREDEDGAYVDRVEPTSCRFCAEPARAARDLIARSQAGEPVLWPNLDLSVTAARDARRLPGQRVAALQKRAVRRELAPLLHNAEVIAVSDTQVKVRLGDEEDAWPMVYERGRWLVDYDFLPKESPLRLSRRQAEDFRPRWRRTSELLALYEPDRAAVDDGVRLTRRVIGAAFDPRDGTVVTAVFDVDRATAGVLRLDPESGEVLDRWLTRAAPRIPIDLETWFDTWHLALSPSGHEVALSSPGQIDVIDLVTGKRETVYSFDKASHVAWVDTSEGDVLVIGQRSAAHLVHGSTHLGVRVDGPTAGAVSTGSGVALLTESGGLFEYDLATRQIVGETTVCCGAARGAAASETRGEILVTCPQTCEVAAERRSLHGPGTTQLAGAGTRGSGAAWSPDGTLFATAAMGDDEGLLLWSSQGEPIATAGTGQVRSLAFDPWGERVLAVTTDGALLLYDVAALRGRGLLGEETE